ncbi:hypothetical protein [Methyloceanibacter caenitepidi]|uniref:Uncharacterized protein n=1 Tax=Methyloceanibacter caenitepidi TaxID=1384459 RepID=A0A0A8K639_9HYPH|nr:hypothetical protein [Methyloceanibacter caenitepidi]BAQ17469.1 hypothetical protein GL4_2022 [Methyloceanibacter caenitepidi]
MIGPRSPRVPVCEDPRAADPASKARHAEVARRYAWDRRDKARDREPWSPAKQLSADLATVYSDHWGELDNDREGRGLFAILLHTLAQRPAFERLAADARDTFAPWLSDDDFERMSAEAIRLKRRWKPDTLAQRIGLTYADQQRLGVHRYIGAVDVPKAERDRLRAERRNANRLDRRRAAGVKPRAEYEANSLSRAEPWKAEGISKATWYRRRKAERDKSGTITKKNTPIGARPVSPPKQAARPLAIRAGMRLGPPPVTAAGPPFCLTPLHAFRDQIAAIPSR